MALVQIIGGLISVALYGGRPPWVLPSILSYGARTFLDFAFSKIAITQLTS